MVRKKSIKFVALNPKDLSGDDDFSDLFFMKLDEIDDLIVEGENIESLSNKFNLKPILFSKFHKESSKTNNFPKELISLPEYLVIQSFTISFFVFIYTNLLHFH